MSAQVQSPGESKYSPLPTLRPSTPTTTVPTGSILNTIGPDKHEDMTETVILSNDSNSGDLHSFEVHQPTLTGFLTVFVFAVTTIILYKCYQRRCFRCWRNTFFYKREPLPRGTHAHPTRSATVQDDSMDEGYCP